MKKVPEVQANTADTSGAFFVAQNYVTKETFEHVLAVHEEKVNNLQNRVRYLEKLIDTKNSPWYKRFWWRIDGWPAWYKVGPKSKRWWHRINGH